MAYGYIRHGFFPVFACLPLVGTDVDPAYRQGHGPPYFETSPHNWLVRTIHLSKTKTEQNHTALERVAVTDALLSLRARRGRAADVRRPAHACSPAPLTPAQRMRRRPGLPHIALVPLIGTGRAPQTSRRTSRTCAQAMRSPARWHPPAPPSQPPSPPPPETDVVLDDDALRFQSSCF